MRVPLLTPEPTDVPPEDMVQVQAEMHFRSLVSWPDQQAFDDAIADPRVRAIAPLMVVRYRGRHARSAAGRLWNAPSLDLLDLADSRPRPELPLEWVAEFAAQGSAVRPWPDGLVLCGQRDDGRWQLAVISGTAYALARRAGGAAAFHPVDHHTAWRDKWTGGTVLQVQWVEIHCGGAREQGHLRYVDVFRRCGWFFLQLWAEDRLLGTVAIDRLEIVAPRPAA